MTERALPPGSPGPSAPPDLPRPWQPRFGLGTLLLVMLVICVMAASASYLARILRAGGRAGQLTFILFTLAAPMLLMVLISVALRVLRRGRGGK